MFRKRSIGSYTAKLSAAISILLLLAALILLFASGAGSARIPGIGLAIKAVAIIVLGYVTYSSVLKHLGLLKFGARTASILLAIADLALGYFYLGSWVMFAGVAMFLTWLVLSL